MLKLLRHHHAKTEPETLHPWPRPSYGIGLDLSEALTALTAMDTSLERGIRELRSPLSD